MASLIERHPQRALIDSMLVEKRPLREIGRTVTPNVSAMALHRYNQRHVKPTLEGVATLSKALQTLAESKGESPVLLDSQAVTQAALAADPLLARIAKHQDTVDQAITDARAGKDARGVAALLNADFRGIELHGQLTGRLSQAQQGPTVAIQINCPAASAAPAAAVQADAITVEIGTPGR